MADDVGVAGGGDGDDVDQVAARAQPLDQRQAVPVRQVEVEQDEVDLVRGQEPGGLAGGPGHPRHLEARHPLDVRHVGLRGELLVLDHEDPHAHGVPPRT